ASGRPSPAAGPGLGAGAAPPGARGLRGRRRGRRGAVVRGGGAPLSPRAGGGTPRASAGPPAHGPRAYLGRAGGGGRGHGGERAPAQSPRPARDAGAAVRIGRCTERARAVARARRTRPFLPRAPSAGSRASRLTLGGP